MSPLRPRPVRFDFSRTPLHWQSGDAQLTHTFNAFHLLLPTGERWFIEVFKEALPQVTDAPLRQRMKAFMGQEDTHARAHAAMLERLRDQGMDPSPIVERLDAGFERALSARPLGREPPKRMWLVHRLGLIAALEHLTCVLATWLWKNSERLESSIADLEMTQCLRWHAAEELEHRRVAWEVLRAFEVPSWQRALAMAEVFPLLTFTLAKGTSALMRVDPTKPAAPTWRRYAQHAVAGELPGMPGLLKAASRFALPGYDPYDEGEMWPTARAFLRELETRTAVPGIETRLTSRAARSGRRP